MPPIPKGLDAFMENSFKFGGTLAWIVGPIGRSVSAEIDSDFNAPIYSYSIIIIESKNTGDDPVFLL